MPSEVPLNLPKFLNWQQNELNDNKNYNNGGVNILCCGSCQVQAIVPGKMPLPEYFVLWIMPSTGNCAW
jgi:hypothetical protein